MFDIQAKFIEERLKSTWISTPIIFEDSGNIPIRGISWVRPIITWVDSALVSGTINDGIFRDVGLVVIDVFTPRTEGVSINDNLCSELTIIFRNWQQDKLKSGSPYTRRVGYETEWFHQRVMIPFQFDYHNDAL